ncbi:MAG TPA: tetratricopeptide repeat protein [Pseudomonas sp.]|nr:tetratricopeptide repeat protein [Pseudomonas sp.]
MNNCFALLLSAALLTGCTRFEPLQTVPPVSTGTQRVVPADPVYGIVSHEMPLVMSASAPHENALEGEIRDIPPRPEPGREALLAAQQAEASGDTYGLLRALEDAAEQGSPQAHYELARHYQNGDGVARSQESALTHLSRADAMGHAEATRVLAWHYLKGMGVAQDIEYGTRLMEKAAWGSTRAQREAGLLYLNIYTPNLNDSARGMELLKAASEAGDSPAMALYKHVFASAGAEPATSPATAATADADAAQFYQAPQDPANTPTSPPVSQ